MYLFILQSVFFYLIMILSKVLQNSKINWIGVRIFLLVQFGFGVFNVLTPDSEGYKESIKFFKKYKQSHMEWVYQEILLNFNYSYYILMLFIFSCIFISIYFLLKIYKKYFKEILYIFTILFLYDFYNISRSSLSNLIFFLGFIYMNKKQIKKGIILMLSSLVFHASSMVLILILFFSKLSWNIKKFMYVYLTIPIFALFFNNNYKKILEILDLKKYGYYFRVFLKIEFKFLMIRGLTTGILYILTIWCIIYFLKNDRLYRGMNKKIINIVIILILLSTMLLFMNVSYFAFERIFQLTSIPLVILLAKIYRKNKKKLDCIFCIYILGKTLVILIQGYRYFINYGI